MISSTSTLRLAGILGAIGIAMGAFAAHGLKSLVDAGTLDPQLFEAFRTGSQYQMYHVLAMLACGCGGEILWQSRWAGRAVAAWTLGIVLFSGSLYLMTLSGARWLGAVTPIGGASFIAGWICIALAARRKA